jgi:hypothetical protein
VTPDEAIAFVERHGVVLASARGPVPRLVDAIAGAPVSGSWWAHASGRRIFVVLQALDDCSDVLVCRLVQGKVSMVHRRLWPALVRAAGHFPAERLARTRQQHTSAGHHVRRDVAFPQWVPPEVMRMAVDLDEQEALDALGPWVMQADKPTPTRGRGNRRRRDDGQIALVARTPRVTASRRASIPSTGRRRYRQ